jgi:hypothetical protein
MSRLSVQPTVPTWQVAVLDDVVEDGRVSVVLRRPADLERAAADIRDVNSGGRRGNV